MNRNYAPGVLDQMKVPAAQAAPAAAEVATASVKAEFENSDRRQTSVPLEWPLKVDGVKYSSIIIRRLNTKQVAAFVESVKDRPEGERITFPVFFGPDGELLPPSVLAELDEDDMEKLNEVAEGFIPRRFRTAMAGGSSQPSGDTTER